MEEIREFAPEVLLLDFYIPPFTGLEVCPGAEAASQPHAGEAERTHGSHGGRSQVLKQVNEAVKNGALLLSVPLGQPPTLSKPYMVERPVCRRRRS